MLSLMAATGTTVTVHGKGPDAEAALDALEELFHKNFSAQARHAE
jgi:phosphotransferase system HPr-like phosphotransfer protein